MQLLQFSGVAHRSVFVSLFPQLSINQGVPLLAAFPHMLAELVSVLITVQRGIAIFKMEQIPQLKRFVGIGDSKPKTLRLAYGVVEVIRRETVPVEHAPDLIERAFLVSSLYSLGPRLAEYLILRHECRSSP